MTLLVVGLPRNKAYRRAGSGGTNFSKNSRDAWWTAAVEYERRRLRSSPSMRRRSPARSNARRDFFTDGWQFARQAEQGLHGLSDARSF